MDIELLYKFRLSLSYTLRRNLYFCSKSKDKLHLNIKNKQAYFVLRSVCTIFAFIQRLIIKINNKHYA